MTDEHICSKFDLLTYNTHNRFFQVILTPPPGCSHWSLRGDKKWDVPGKVANRKGRPEPTKKTEKKTADDASERRESIVSENLKLV